MLTNLFNEEIDQKLVDRLNNIAKITDDLITYESDEILIIINSGLPFTQTENPIMFPNCVFVSRPLGYGEKHGLGWSWSDCYAEGIIGINLNLVKTSKFHRVVLNDEYTYYLDTIESIEKFHRNYAGLDVHGNIGIYWNKVLAKGIGAVGTTGVINIHNELNSEQRRLFTWFHTFSGGGYGFVILDPRAIFDHSVIQEHYDIVN